MLAVVLFFTQAHKVVQKGERGMATNRKPSGRAMSMPAGVLMGTLISIAVSLLGSLLTAYLLSKETLRETGIGYAAMATLIAASLSGCIIAVGRIKHRRMLVCMLCAVSYFGTLLAMTALFFGGQYSGVGVTALLIFGSCSVVALLGLKKERTFVNRRKKRAYR